MLKGLQCDMGIANVLVYHSVDCPVMLIEGFKIVMTSIRGNDASTLRHLEGFMEQSINKSIHVEGT